MDALAKRAEPCYIGGGLYATQLENSCIAISVGSPNKAPVCYFDQSVISNLAQFANSTLPDLSTQFTKLGKCKEM